MSLVASFTSAATIVGIPSNVYFYGIIGIWQSKKINIYIYQITSNVHTNMKIFLFSVVAYALSTVITAHVFIPIYHGLKLSSSYEVTELEIL